MRKGFTLEGREINNTSLNIIRQALIRSGTAWLVACLDALLERDIEEAFFVIIQPRTVANPFITQNNTNMSDINPQFRDTP